MESPKAQYLCQHSWHLHQQHAHNYLNEVGIRRQLGVGLSIRQLGGTEKDAEWGHHPHENLLWQVILKDENWKDSYISLPSQQPWGQTKPPD